MYVGLITECVKVSTYYARCITPRKRHGVSICKHIDCLIKNLLRLTTKEISKIFVTESLWGKTVDSLHKGPVQCKPLSFPGGIMGNAYNWLASVLEDGEPWHNPVAHLGFIAESFNVSVYVYLSARVYVVMHIFLVALDSNLDVKCVLSPTSWLMFLWEKKLTRSSQG